jgi:hypothetical protein
MEVGTCPIVLRRPPSDPKISGKDAQRRVHAFLTNSENPRGLRYAQSTLRSASIVTHSATPPP